MFTRLGAYDGKPESRHAALLAFCAETIGVSHGRLELAHNALGAPLLLIDGGRSDWTISSSARQGLCLFGAARGRQIGVDVELYQAIEPAWNILHPEERATLRDMPRDGRPAHFLKIWTVKEAYLKALGLGLRREPESIRVMFESGRPDIFDIVQGRTVAHAEVWRADAAICASAVLEAA